MSNIFYDHLTNLEKVEKKIKKVARTSDERQELYQLIDEIVHHKVLGIILSRLPESHHKEFLDNFTQRPHDKSLFQYLKERIVEDIEEFIKDEIHKLSVELLLLIEHKTSPKLSPKKKK